MRVWAMVLITLVLPGCVSAGDAAVSVDEGEEQDSVGLRFASPVQVNAAAQEGFEPSLRIAGDGTIYAAAARGFLAGGSGNLASPVWFSHDEGKTWSVLESGMSTRERMKAIEGDLAVDAVGNVYFVDTYMADNVLTVWEPDQSWRSTHPVHGTLAIDDRPWLAAHGDGIVYYVANSAAALPAPDRATDPWAASRYWFYRSEDGGSTWTLGHAFPGADYCHVAANPVDDQTVVVVCTPAVGVRVGTAEGVLAYVSNDRGSTWEQSLLGSIVEPSAATNFPSVAFAPDGAAYAVWVDDGVPSQVHVRMWDRREWLDVATPSLDVRAANPWIAAGTGGVVAVAFYGHDGSAWHLHVWKRTVTGQWLHGIDPEPVSFAPCPPEDFFQIAMDASSLVHAVYQRDPDRDQCAGVRPATQPILHMREIGPES